MDRQNQMRENGSRGLEVWLREMDGVTVFPSYAQFEDPHSVRVGEDLIQGEMIIINAGERPRLVPFQGIENVDWLDNIRLLDLNKLPDHLVIIGGSYISLEFAQIFRRLGSQVTVLEAGPQLMFREDEDIAAASQKILEGEEIEFYLDVGIKRVDQPKKEQIQVFFTQKGKDLVVQGSHLLLAVGRVPNSDRLNLEAAGVTVDDRDYIQVNETMQTSVPHIYAVGDINGEGAFTHTAVNDGEIFWDHFLGEGDRSLTERIPIYAMFIDPPLGRVGITEKDARKSDRNIWMATREMKHFSRAREKDETAGLVKILVDMDTEEIVGAAILGVSGDEVINLFAPFMYTGQSYQLFRETVLTHPTVSELMPWILDDLTPLE
jgi:pyruvate/2-oxoglutarate dehydrogenase complex dihydrolipoamide dehydrogenase (E3) component